MCWVMYDFILRYKLFTEYWSNKNNTGDKSVQRVNLKEITKEKKDRQENKTKQKKEWKLSRRVGSQANHGNERLTKKCFKQ